MNPDQGQKKFDFVLWRSHLKERDWKKAILYLELCFAGGNENPLDSTDAEGNTPIHIALEYKKVPPSLLINMIQRSPSAVRILNAKSRLPLHIAVIHRSKAKVIAALMLAYPNSGNQIDVEGKCPLTYAFEGAIQKSQIDTVQSWKVPDQELKEWQEKQDKRWDIVHWLLVAKTSDMFSCCQTLKKYPMLLMDALIYAAPPDVVSMLVDCSREFLENTTDNVLACFCMYLCIYRQYPLSVLENLALHCPEAVRVDRDESGMGPVSAHFVIGCFKQDAKIKWKPSATAYREIDACLDGSPFSDRTPAFQEWWDKLKFLILYCQNKDGQYNDNKNNKKKENLLYAALTNSDVPPAATSLILELEPSVLQENNIWTDVLPLHLACMVPEYVPRKYEQIMTPETSTVSYFLGCVRADAARCRYKGRLPLHIALAHGKHWDHVKQLVSVHRRALKERDPITGLYCFQLAATNPLMLNAHNQFMYMARNRVQDEIWQGFSLEEKSKQIGNMLKHYEIEKVNTTFELLRRYPGALKSALSKSSCNNNNNNNEDSKVRDATGLGLVGAHFIRYFYREADDGSKERQPIPENIALLQTVIEEASIDSSPETFKVWWEDMKSQIWNCFGGLPSIFSNKKTKKVCLPHQNKDDTFLLHAALCSSDMPPPVIHLLLKLHPQSCNHPIPHYDILPIHIASVAPSYTPRHYEQLCLEYPSKLVLVLQQMNPCAIHARDCYGRLPLHLALEANKTRSEIKPLMEKSRSADLIDWNPMTNLLPFQSAATCKSLTPDDQSLFRFKARNYFTDAEWTQKTLAERNEELKKVRQSYKNDIVTTTFTLLRSNPNAIMAACRPESRTTRKQQQEMVKEKKATREQDDGNNKNLEYSLQKLMRDQHMESTMTQRMNSSVVWSMQSFQNLTAAGNNSHKDLGLDSSLMMMNNSIANLDVMAVVSASTTEQPEATTTTTVALKSAEDEKSTRIRSSSMDESLDSTDSGESLDLCEHLRQLKRDANDGSSIGFASFAESCVSFA